METSKRLMPKVGLLLVGLLFASCTPSPEIPLCSSQMTICGAYLGHADWVYKCSDDGMKWILVEKCASGQCKDGKCVLDGDTEEQQDSERIEHDSLPELPSESDVQPDSTNDATEHDPELEPEIELELELEIELDSEVESEHMVDEAESPEKVEPDSEPERDKADPEPDELESEEELPSCQANTCSRLPSTLCPSGMIALECCQNGRMHRYCIDQYEASQDGQLAISIPNAVPWTVISWSDAQEACANAGKRLCTYKEWFDACSNAGSRVYCYGNEYHPDYCNGSDYETTHHLHTTGSLENCEGAFEGLFDMSGNAWEWINDSGGSCSSTKNYRCLIGGSYASFSDKLKCNSVAPPDDIEDPNEIGFRCCIDLDGD